MPTSGHRLWVWIAAGVTILILASRKLFAVTENFRVDYQAPKTPEAIPYAELFEKWSLEMDVPWRLMAALVKRESNFNAFAVNTEQKADVRFAHDVESIGLAQILWPDTAKALDPNVTREELFKPDTNLRLQAMLLKQLLRRFPETNEEGFPASAVSAYNAGVPTKANSAYVLAVEKNWETYA